MIAINIYKEGCGIMISETACKLTETGIYTKIYSYFIHRLKNTFLYFIAGVLLKLPGQSTAAVFFKDTFVQFPSLFD